MGCDLNNEKLKKARENAGLKQHEVAKKLGITLTSYQRFEYGTRLPSLSTAFKLAEILGTSVEALFKNHFS